MALRNAPFSSLALPTSVAFGADRQGSGGGGGVGGDMLHLLPSLIRSITSAGGLDAAASRSSADNILNWASMFLPPARALHLFLEMHAGGLWGAARALSLMRLAPRRPGSGGGGVISIDLRHSQPVTASLILNVYLSHLAVVAASGEEEEDSGGADRQSPARIARQLDDILVLPGPWGDRNYGHVVELLQRDVVPPLRDIVPLSRGVLIRAEVLGAWCAERRKLALD